MFGQRLRLARKRAGLSMRELANATVPRVTAQAISKYEAGKMLPSSAVLLGLGNALGVSLDFLMSAQLEALDRVEYRKNSGASARDLAKAEALVIDKLERYLAIEHILGIAAEVDWADRRRSARITDESEIDARADKLRSDWDLGLDPVPSLCELLENKGIKVLETDLPESINGLSCHAFQEHKIVAEAVLLSNRINVERKRFTLAHELARRLIRTSENSAIDLERAMNRFAGAFLMPGQCLRDDVGTNRQRISYYEIICLKKIYGVSAAALLMRLGQIGVLSAKSVKHTFATFARTWRKSEPDPILPDHGFATFEKPRRFERLVWRALCEELISPVRAATLLDQSLESVEQQICGPAGP